MPTNLALHRADVLTDPAVLGTLIEGVGVIVRRNEGKLIRGRDIIATMRVDRIVELDRQRVYRIESADGAWLVRRVGGCVSCSKSSSWPIR